MFKISEGHGKFKILTERYNKRTTHSVIYLERDFYFSVPGWRLVNSAHRIKAIMEINPPWLTDEDNQDFKICTMLYDYLFIADNELGGKNQCLELLHESAQKVNLILLHERPSKSQMLRLENTGLSKCSVGKKGVKFECQLADNYWASFSVVRDYDAGKNDISPNPVDWAREYLTNELFRLSAEMPDLDILQKYRDAKMVMDLGL